MLLRRLETTLMSTGVLSRGWYALLTGAVLLYLAYVLGSVAAENDPAAPVVTVMCAVAGLWQLGRGYRSELRREPSE